MTADKAKARDLLETAAKQGQPVAMYNLALLLIEGVVAKPDLKAAEAWMRKSADLGNADAAYAYAVMLDEAGTPGNDAAITRYMGEAARAGHVAAEVEYAIRLINGHGAPKDVAEAVKYLVKAAWSGNPVAQNRLAHLKVLGVGVPYDAVDAAKWHLLARAGGVPDLKLDELLAGLTPDEREAALRKAQSWPDVPLNPGPGGFNESALKSVMELRGPLDSPKPDTTPAPEKPAAP